MISFVIPTLNEEKVLEKTLSWVTTYGGPREIIVSDGGSTDQTISIAKKFADHVVVHSGPSRQTIGQGRNAGAYASHGEFIVFLDADTYIENIDNAIYRLSKIFEERPQVVGITAPLRVFKEMETLGDKIIFRGYINGIYWLLNNVLHTGGTPGEFQMVRRDAFMKINGFNEKLAAGEDNDMFTRLAKVGRTHFESSITVFHTGRRAHHIGWPKLLWLWFLNGVYVPIFKKSWSKVWTVIR